VNDLSAPLPREAKPGASRVRVRRPKPYRMRARFEVDRVRNLPHSVHAAVVDEQ
jgi:hypothetical protein